MDLSMEKHKIQQLVREGKSYKEISKYLGERYPYERGLSERSIRRFCTQNGINKRSIFDEDYVDSAVSSQVSCVGSSYGRKMMTGLLRSKGMPVGEVRVGKSLKRLHPESHKRRTETAGRSLNPKCYKADYFGHKVHIDQNEKLVMYGVTHILARDGFSGMIVANATIPVKNNPSIYENIFRSFVQNYGMWDQIRVDGGGEFKLICHVQDQLRKFRTNPSIEPFKTTKSTDNNIIERIWVEVNSRVNYPLKEVLNKIVNEGYIDMGDATTKFAVSWITCAVARAGIETFINAWNHHSIPGKGVPQKLFQSNNQTYQIDMNQLLSTDDAMRLYTQVTGNTLKSYSIFGADPLEHYPGLQEQRAVACQESLQSWETIFHHVANNNSDSFKKALFFYVNYTRHLYNTYCNV